jgi:hypothetical protein
MTTNFTPEDGTCLGDHVRAVKTITHLNRVLQKKNRCLRALRLNEDAHATHNEQLKKTAADAHRKLRKVQIHLNILLHNTDPAVRMKSRKTLEALL